MCQISRLLFWKSPQECQNVTIEFCFIMRISYELRCAVIIEILWTFYQRVFQLNFKNIQNIFLELSAGQVCQNCRASLAIPPGTSVATIVTICCNHRDGEFFLHRIIRKLGSTATSTVITRLLPLTNYISSTKKWDTVGFVRAHQRKYWNALIVGRGHADDGCSCNHRAVPPSEFAWRQLSLWYSVFIVSHGTMNVM